MTESYNVNELGPECMNISITCQGATTFCHLATHSVEREVGDGDCDGDGDGDGDELGIL